MDKAKKQYGLINLKKKEDRPLGRPLASVFGDDDDEEDSKVDVSYQKTSASTIRVMKGAERLHERALAEDPSIFNYDEAYEEIQAIKNEKLSEQKEKDKDRKAKYAEAIIKAHKRREIETASREERQQQKERIKEGEEFADKEVFVTGAYRKQMEEVQKFRQEEAYEARFNELTAVDKQKMWQAGIGRTLLDDISRSAETAESVKQAFLKKKNMRKRLDSGEDKEDEKEEPKKSIYSDDEEGPAFEPPPVKKNFEGGIRPGLNKVTKKAETKIDKIRQRQFTPTPPSSDDEGKRGRSSPKDDREKEHRSWDSDHDHRHRKESDDRDRKLEKKPKDPRTDKATRLANLKKILQQRNGPEEIEEFRKRYLERRESGVVVPPL